VDQLDAWAQGLVATPWVFAVVFVFAFVDAFFPPIPSESVIIAMAAIWSTTGEPALAVVFLAAAGGAFCGDQATYQVGRLVSLRRVWWFRRPRGQGALDWAEQALARRGAAFIIAARYIPVGRVAVNVVAGALRYHLPRFMAVDAVACTMWAAYSVAIGVVAGQALGDYPFAAVVAGVAGGATIGIVVDLTLRRLRPPGPAPGPPPDARS